MEKWRYRIETMGVYLLDDSEKIVPNSDIHSLFYFAIKFPMVFNDIDSDKDSHTFTTEPFNCNSKYEGKGEEFLEECKIAKQFSQRSPDGVFEFRLGTIHS